MQHGRGTLSRALASHRSVASTNYDKKVDKMVKALVTGGTGFVGSHIARMLVEDGHTVRVLHRTTSKLTALEGVDYESAIGDITDLESLRVACGGVDWLFHVAAVADYWRADKSRMFEANVEGTRSVLQAARDAGVKRVIFTSSAAAVGWGEKGNYADETMPFNMNPDQFPYGYSKVLAEEVVAEAVAEGQDVVTLNPVVVMGPGDLNMISGSFIIQTKRLPLLPYTSGGIAVIDVRDVARAHLSAAEKGRTGERYILGTANYPLKTVYEMSAKAVGVRRLFVYTPDFFVPLMAILITLLRALRIPIPVDANQARMSVRDIYFDYSKAWSELGEPQIDMQQSLNDTYQWYRAHGYIK
jgi:dihydroflavonol-4-reductase